MNSKFSIGWMVGVLQNNVVKFYLFCFSGAKTKHVSCVGLVACSLEIDVNAYLVGVFLLLEPALKITLDT